MKGKNVFQLKLGDFAEQENDTTLENAAQYAAVTGDKNPLHFETPEAMQSRYGRPIVHGMVLAGYISGVIGMKLPGLGCIYQSQTLSFMRPVFYGDTIRTCVTVTDINTERNRVTLKTECFNQKYELVLSGEAVVLPRK